MTIRGWLIYSKQDAKENASFIQWFLDEAKKQQIDLTFMLREDLQIGIMNQRPTILNQNKPIDRPHFSIVRTVEPLLQLHLEQLGIKTFNSSYVSRICNDKMLTHLEVNKLNIPMVNMLFYNRKDLTNTPPLPYPLIIKNPTGRGGREVFLIKNDHDWVHFSQQTTFEHVLIQTTDVQQGKDLRVFVIGKKIIGAVLRESDTDFRANFKLGGKATWYNLSHSESALIQQIINHFDFGMVGIDFLFNHSGDLIFNEIEDVVGSRTLSAVSSINTVGKYLSFIKEKIELERQ